MFKLVKYLKPFIFYIIAAIALLFIQALTDLSLPNYMSDIVNIGIQQAGIESSVPDAIRKSKMDEIAQFMSPQEREQVLECYDLIDKSGMNFDKYIKKYPALSNEPVFVIKNVDKSRLELLNPIFSKALLAASMSEKSKNELSINENKKYENLDESMKNQASVSLVSAEYEALGMDISKIQRNYILNTGFIMLLITLVGMTATIIVGLLSSKVAAGVAKNIRKDVFTKVESFSNLEFDKFSTASLITRTTNDITQIQTLVFMTIRMVLFAPITGIGGVILAINKSPSMSWMIALAVIVVLGLILIVFSIAVPKFKAIQKLVDRLNLVIRENLSGMMVIRAFNTQKFEEKRFDRINQELTDTHLFVNRVMATMFPSMTLIINGGSVLLMWIGAHQIANANMPVGDLMAFMQYTAQVIFSFLMLSMMFIMLPRASVSAQRVAEVLDVNPEITDPVSPKHYEKKINGIVEFRNVSFRYPGANEDMLKGISFTALPGQTTAIIGSTGAGKTTLVNLIPRFYDVTAGQILIDGIDIRDVPQHELREHIGYVPQKSMLFSGTIESNLKYADENAIEDEIRTACEIAQAIEFISQKPDSFRSEISQGGSNVSGGQRQRLSIARAIVKKPEIYIFDDSFSALDFKTDASLRKALKKHTASSTVIIVAQRVSTIKNAEQIIVLDEGRIVGIGTHNELIKNCNTYREIVSSQLSKEELA
ncbi:ABC transporter ATP-binding protein [Acetivibrio straminisolvens]|uniref:Lipid A export ATP-binding/permease protein MsbA n=1 Tax=Acetivibrio straminisolvens JCM 21531 TaxID=1294263 RepID=W4V3M3_9FIRM|nr:ABC transporter ATP-binding protein [Acetivibrio straminisolvens]GAE87334.1 lipid A export ATP-binding/permease protein MsbA [Acetivibrio straminisolvens JCM 21531]